MNTVAGKICFVSPFGYGALSGGSAGHVGGVERQTSLMARWFSQRGYGVSMVTWDEGQPEDCAIDGIRVIKICRQDAGIRGLRFFHPRWSGLSSALRRAEADVYYQNNAEYVTGQVALWCRSHGKRFVFSVANDPECDPRMPLLKTFRERVLYKYGLMHADKIIVQTGVQQDMLQRGTGLKSEVIPMPCPGPAAMDSVPDFEKRARNHVLWAARIVPVKRLEWLLEIAQSAPDIVFDVVGPYDGSAYAAEMLTRTRGLPNVCLRGSVPRSEMARYYRNGVVFCSTSRHEGFPNTFLEAWSNGMPTVSTFDPDNLIRRCRLGGVGGNPHELLLLIRGLLDDASRWQEASANARAYFLDRHAVPKTMPFFERAIVGKEPEASS